MDPIHQAWWLPAGARYLYFYLRDLSYTLGEYDPWPHLYELAEEIGEEYWVTQYWLGALWDTGAVRSRFLKARDGSSYPNEVVWGGPVRLARHPEPVYGHQRRRVFEEYRYTCQLCRECTPRVELTIDHIIATTQGGIHDEANWWPLCRPCNSRKGDRPAWLFLPPQEKERIRSYLEDVQPIARRTQPAPGGARPVYWAPVPDDLQPACWIVTPVMEEPTHE